MEESEELTLAEYLKKYHVSREQFALRCGITAAAVGHYLYGLRKPRDDLRDVIEHETAGRVKATSWDK